jgi:hypothetical protein
MTTLILGPILAATLVAGGQPAAGHTTTVADTATASRVVFRIAPFAIAQSLRVQADAEAVATPAPTPMPTLAPTPRPQVVQAAPPVVPPADPNSVIGIIQAAAARWGVSGDWMVKIARCESGLRTNAYNPSGPYIGLFQFLQSTFRANGGTNIYDAADQSNITAKMLAHGQAHQWSCA